jgi:predicted permease
LVVLQIALSLVLLVAAGLFLRSLLDAQAVRPGFNPRSVLLNTLFLSGYDEARGTQFYRELIERVQLLPEVRVASLMRRVPLGLGGLGSANIVVEGYPQETGERPWAYVNFASPGLFRTLEVPLMGGREFTFQDTRDTARVAVINQMMASQYFRGTDPVGRQIQIDQVVYNVVGVAADFKVRQLNEDPVPLVFLSVLQTYRPDMTLMVRSIGDASHIAPPVRNIVREMDAQIQLVAVRTLERHIETATFPQRASASFLSLFAVLALLLAAVGIYGVMAYSIAQRTREIGIRIALGAQRYDILRLLLREGFTLTLAGVTLGLLGAFAVSRLLGEFLLNIDSSDGLTFTIVTILLSVVALVACYLPARRAMRVDPVVALRNQPLR